MSMIRDRIAAYYPAIDKLDTDQVLALFAEDASYRRADTEYRTIEEIRNFFCDGRKIRGRHDIESLWSDEERGIVFVTGRFEGVGEHGDPRAVDFADIWHFNSDGLVGRRCTYLALGHAYVER